MIDKEERRKTDDVKTHPRRASFSSKRKSLKTSLSVFLPRRPGCFPRLTHPSHARGSTKNLRKQDLDIAIIKATSSATHVAPKEKHVATLKAAVGPQAPRAQVSYVCRELRARLRSATDWLVRGDWRRGGDIREERRERKRRKRHSSFRAAVFLPFFFFSFFLL